jgi:regulator of nonsense transcripts 2
MVVNRTKILRKNSLVGNIHRTQHLWKPSFLNFFLLFLDKENRDTPHYRLMMLLEQELPECHRREQIDEIAERFCSTHGSSKNSRKRLQQTLFSVPQSRLDLLPYYSRMAATVDRVWMDISSILVTDLEQQFHGQAKYKKNQNLDSRMKTARYIGELTKFRVAPPIVALRCMQRCIEDFTGSNVDVACCLLESCGRFLYRTKHASARLVTVMETMTRLSKAKVSHLLISFPFF